jgi:peptide-methionine (R)-S-oxide reductase
MQNNLEERERTMTEKIKKTDAEWQQQLTPEQFQVARKAGTEPAFTGKYWKTKDAGTYACACCGEPLFSSETKFDSGTGWPSFYQAVDKSKVEEKSDRAYGMVISDTCLTMVPSRLGCGIA